MDCIQYPSIGILRVSFLWEQKQKAPKAELPYVGALLWSCGWQEDGSKKNPPDMPYGTTSSSMKLICHMHIYENDIFHRK